MSRGAGRAIEIDADGPAVLPGAEALVRAGVSTGASSRNWASSGAAVRLPAGLPDWRRDLLTDPQTSGGLLIAVAADRAQALLALAKARGFEASRVVGRVTDGPAEVVVR
jgi:selenide,water dikinase